MERSGTTRFLVLPLILEGVFINLKHMQFYYIYFQMCQWGFHVFFHGCMLKYFILNKIGFVLCLV